MGFSQLPTYYTVFNGILNVGWWFMSISEWNSLILSQLKCINWYDRYNDNLIDHAVKVHITIFLAASSLSFSWSLQFLCVYVCVCVVYRPLPGNSVWVFWCLCRVHKFNTYNLLLCEHACMCVCVCAYVYLCCTVCSWFCTNRLHCV